jgi:hypothetical protein
MGTKLLTPEVTSSARLSTPYSGVVPTCGATHNAPDARTANQRACIAIQEPSRIGKPQVHLPPIPHRRCQNRQGTQFAGQLESLAVKSCVEIGKAVAGKFIDWAKSDEPAD